MMTVSNSVSSRRLSPRLALLAASLGLGLIGLDVTVVNVALGSIEAQYAASMTNLQWVMNAYTVAFASLLLGAGSFSDRFGARRVFALGVALFAMASLACAAAPGIEAQILARLLQGAAAALCVPASMALVNASFPDPRARAHAIGVWTGTASLTLGAGPLVGGAVVSHFGWPSVFLINLPICLAAMWLSWRFAPDTLRHRTTTLNVPSQLVAIVALALLSYLGVEFGELGWKHPAIITSVALLLVASITYVRMHRRSVAPMVPRALLASGPLTATSVIGLLLNFGYYGLMFALSYFLQRAMGFTPLATGLAFLPMTALVSVANFAAGPLITRFGSLLVVVLGQGLAAFGYLGLCAVDRNSSFWGITVPLLGIGAGIAFAVPAISAALLSDVEPQHVGIASGIQNMARQVGGVLGVGVFGTLLAVRTDLLERGLHLSALLACAAMLAGMGLAIRSFGRRRGTAAALSS